jgi:serine/threonine protein kinase
MGVVYKAQDTKLDRLVSMKFHPAGAVSFRDEIVRFEQEARAISALKHPTIAIIHDIDEAMKWGSRRLSSILCSRPGSTIWVHSGIIPDD